MLDAVYKRLANSKRLFEYTGKVCVVHISQGERSLWKTESRVTIPDQHGSHICVGVSPDLTLALLVASRFISYVHNCLFSILVASYQHSGEIERKLKRS